MAEKCTENRVRQPCFESLFDRSARYPFGKFEQGTIIRIATTERKLVTIPKMTFEEMLINLLNVVGIWLGVSITDCITSLVNGLNWIDNQRIR